MRTPIISWTCANTDVELGPIKLPRCLPTRVGLPDPQEHMVQGNRSFWEWRLMRRPVYWVRSSTSPSTASLGSSGQGPPFHLWSRGLKKRHVCCWAICREYLIGTASMFGLPHQSPTRVLYTTRPFNARMVFSITACVSKMMPAVTVGPPEKLDPLLCKAWVRNMVSGCLVTAGGLESVCSTW